MRTAGPTLLLDTHTVIWWFNNDRRLGAKARHAIETAPFAYISAASTWEVALKLPLGRLDLNDQLTEDFAGTCFGHGFSLAPVEHADTWAVRELPPVHKDPFDRLLIASARRRGWTLVSADPVFDRYDVPLLRP